MECRLETQPRRDPGCYYEGAEFLQGQHAEAAHALLVLDQAWDGVPTDSASLLEALLEERPAQAE